MTYRDIFWAPELPVQISSLIHRTAKQNANGCNWHKMGLSKGSPRCGIGKKKITRYDFEKKSFET